MKRRLQLRVNTSLRSDDSGLRTAVLSSPIADLSLVSNAVMWFDEMGDCVSLATLWNRMSAEVTPEQKQHHSFKHLKTVHQACLTDLGQRPEAGNSIENTRCFPCRVCRNLETGR